MIITSSVIGFAVAILMNTETGKEVFLFVCIGVVEPGS